MPRFKETEIINKKTNHSIISESKKYISNRSTMASKLGRYVQIADFKPSISTNGKKSLSVNRS